MRMGQKVASAHKQINQKIYPKMRAISNTLKLKLILGRHKIWGFTYPFLIRWIFRCQFPSFFGTRKEGRSWYVYEIFIQYLIIANTERYKGEKLNIWALEYATNHRPCHIALFSLLAIILRRGESVNWRNNSYLKPSATVIFNTRHFTSVSEGTERQISRESMVAPFEKLLGRSWVRMILTYRGEILAEKCNKTHRKT